MISPKAAISVADCVCDELAGFKWQQESRSGKNSTISTNDSVADARHCHRKPQTVTIAEAKATAQVVTSVVVAAVATNVVIAVSFQKL